MEASEPSPTYTDYFSTVAEVVPALFILLAIEVRERFEYRGKDLGRTWAIWFIVAGFLLAMAEVFALHVLASDASHKDWKWVVGSFLLVGGLMTLAAIFGPEKKPPKRVAFVFVLIPVGLALFFTVDWLLAS